MTHVVCTTAFIPTIHCTL